MSTMLTIHSPLTIGKEIHANSKGKGNKNLTPWSLPTTLSSFEHLHTTTKHLPQIKMYLTKYNHQNQQQDEGVPVPLPLSRSRGRITNEDDGWNDSDTDSTTTEDSATAGLGINFYDHRGVGRRSVIHSRNNLKEDTQAEDKEGEVAESHENEEEETGYEALQVLSQQSRTTNNQLQLHAQPTNGHTPRAQQLQLQQQQQTPSFSSSGGSSSNFNSSQTSTELELQTPKLLAPLQDPDWDHASPLDLINQYLEHNYRQQAESFVRIASRETPVRALSLGLSGSRPGGRAGGRVTSASDRSVLGLGIASTVTTPSLPRSSGGAGAVSSPSDETSLILEDEKEDQRQSPSFNHHSTSLQLRSSQQSASTSTLIRSTSSTSSLSIPVQPLSRIQQASKLSRQRSIASISNSSGFSPLVPLSSPLKSSGTPTNTSPGKFQLRGSGIVRVPIHSKPTIAKRGSRPSSSTSTQTIATTSTRTSKVLRGPEYFTREERLYIARLVHSVARNCERHTNCKDCIDLEYAYYENRFLPRNMDPEQRQKIINNNRSLRNIKNVCLPFSQEVWGGMERAGGWLVDCLTSGFFRQGYANYLSHAGTRKPRRTWSYQR